MAKERMIELLFELLKNSKRSDRELSKILKVSQPTITRTRRKLEKTGYIKEYTVIPDFAKLGFELIAFIFTNIAVYNPKTGITDTEGAKKCLDWLEKNPNVVFCAEGDGLKGKNCMIVSLHRSFTEFTNFVTDFRAKWSGQVLDIESFLVSLKTGMAKCFTFKHIPKIP
ncbi:MAG: Lrp/AsnC family transcriptional regulator [Candidatus Bathyarchaeia archaeon]